MVKKKNEPYISQISVNLSFFFFNYGSFVKTRRERSARLEKKNKLAFNLYITSASDLVWKKKNWRGVLNDDLCNEISHLHNHNDNVADLSHWFHGNSNG